MSSEKYIAMVHFTYNPFPFFRYNLTLTNSSLYLPPFTIPLDAYLMPLCLYLVTLGGL